MAKRVSKSIEEEKGVSSIVRKMVFVDYRNLAQLSRLKCVPRKDDTDYVGEVRKLKEIINH
jgi:hypothetical protein